MLHDLFKDRLLDIPAVSGLAAVASDYDLTPDIRAAQQSLWVAGLALEGPDSDALKAEFRENDGKGVHFSGPGLREHAARWVAKVAPWLEQNLNSSAPGESNPNR